MTLYQIIVGVSLAWGLASSIAFGYALIWQIRHPRRKFTPPTPRPPRQPFVGTVHRTLPSVEPIRKIGRSNEAFIRWLNGQELKANGHIAEDNLLMFDPSRHDKAMARRLEIVKRQNAANK